MGSIKNEGAFGPLYKMMKKILEILYRWSGKINSWAWQKLYGKRDYGEWIKGYKKWKKDDER